MFADPDGKNVWIEYRSLNAVPELNPDEGGVVAKMSAGSNGDVMISKYEPGQDFAAYTDYCFDPAGELIQLRFELRTAWGWGYREEGPILKGRLAPKLSEFFSMKTDAHMSKPEEAGDIPEALTPKLYLRKSQLPFFKLLSK